jgi:hypothetical protein
MPEGHVAARINLQARMPVGSKPELDRILRGVTHHGIVEPSLVSRANMKYEVVLRTRGLDGGAKHKEKRNIVRTLCLVRSRHHMGSVQFLIGLT